MHTPFRPFRREPASGGFTLVELLTVIAIVGILAAILIPVVGRARDSAKATQCLSNLRQMGTAARLYSHDNKNWTPPLGYKFFQAVWPYAYSTSKTIAISGSDLPPDLAGSIFECSKATDDSAPTVTTKRSYGINSYLGPNTSADKTTMGVPLNLIATPSVAVLAGDVKNMSGLQPSTCNDRHNSKMNIVYVDGHAAAVTLTTELTATSTWNTNPFWVGVYR